MLLKTKTNNLIFLLSVLFVLISARQAMSAAICGNNIREGAEECDNGSNNSDSRPNACRTNCVLPKCGDYGVDNGEECDDFPNNSDVIPNACRRDCKKAHCGDGVLDEGEECDDKNNDAYDGCHQCQECYLPKDDLFIGGSEGQEIKLCPGRYEFKDEGQEGIIILDGQGVTLNCQGAQLVGLPFTFDSALEGSSKVAAMGSKILSQGLSGLRSQRRGKSSAPATAPAGQGGSTSPKPPVPPGAVKYTGTGIVIRNYDDVLLNCYVETFKTGVKVQFGGNVLLNNHICGNTMDIRNEGNNYGLKNSCASHENWQENGSAGCMLSCN